MVAERVCPEAMRVLWIADGDVTGHALCEAFAAEDSKGTGHVLEDPSAVLFMVCEGGDAGKRYALRDGLEGGLPFDVLVLGGYDEGLIVLLVVCSYCGWCHGADAASRIKRQSKTEELNKN